MEKVTTRKIVLDILVDIEKNKGFSNITINKHLKRENITSVDRRFITELVYGVLENKIYLDFIIGKFSKLKIKKINIKILNILRMSLYQMIYLNKVPSFAAVNESVNLAKKVDYRATGYVNGLLRNFLRNKENIKIPTLEENPIEHLCITYSHPRWMVEKWLKEFGQNFTKELLESNNKTPKLVIRTNTLKISKEELKNQLVDENIQVEEGFYIKEALQIRNVGNIEELISYKKGLFQVQDESSMLVAHILDPKPGEWIIDVCAAPGGKTTHIAQLMRNKGYILARDVYDHKLKIIKENASRLGIDIIRTQNFNAKEFDVNLVEKADRVLVDAPCSGLGIIRRKPELKYNKEPDDVKKIKKLQLEILKNASKYVKKGGSLVYSTCTIEREENIGVIEEFIKDNHEFEMVDIQNILPEEIRGEKKYLQLYPNIHKIDGFFICKLMKKS